MEAPTVEIITEDQRQQAISSIVLAFTDDPVMRWIFPRGYEFLEAFPDFSDAFGGGAIEHGSAFNADAFKGTAFWLPPGIKSNEEAMLAVLTEFADQSALEDAEGFMEQMASFHPEDENCWYLTMIGVDSAYQGQGLGAALMKHALKQVDESGGSAYLESSNPRNLSLYQRHGFETMGIIQHGSSPEMTPMYRPAR